MNAVFADSYYFFGLLNPRDEAHLRVMRFNSILRGSIVTTAWVLTEVGDGLAHSSTRSLFLKLVQSLVGDPRVQIEMPAPAVFDAGVALYDARSDKQWSLTDCISFEILRMRGITEALTADHHFEQAGFKALLKPAAG